MIITNYSINSPIWKTKSVGLAEWKMKGMLEVDIMYRELNGERLYPDTYQIETERAMTYPRQYVSGVWVRLIPISELTILK